MREEDTIRTRGGTDGYGGILREIINSSKDLVRSEVGLVTAELKTSAQGAKTHMTQLAIFGGLLALSVLPFLAFLVIGLGEILGGRYWLSSLIVAVVCAAVGGTMAYRAFKRLSEDDLDFSRTRDRLKEEASTVREKVDDVRYAAKGAPYEPDTLH